MRRECLEPIVSAERLPDTIRTLEQRVHAASALLNELGGTTDVEKNSGHFLIRGHGCPLAAATAEHPEACNALASLLSEFVGQPVSKCCDLYDRQRCCFEVAV